MKNSEIQNAIKKLDKLYPKDSHILTNKNNEYILSSPIINGFEIGGEYGHVLKRFKTVDEFVNFVDELIEDLECKAEEDETKVWFSPLHKLAGIKWGELPKDIQYYLITHSNIWEEDDPYSNERIIDFVDSWLSIGGEIAPEEEYYCDRIKIDDNVKLYLSTGDELFE